MPYHCSPLLCSLLTSICFFFNDPATTEIYTLSLHDALPISNPPAEQPTYFTEATKWFDRFLKGTSNGIDKPVVELAHDPWEDRKSTRLNSSHVEISYAVFCLKKKKKLESQR